jgi:hypothetical protein
MNRRDRSGKESTRPEPKRLVPSIVTGFLDVGGVDLHFFGRHSCKRHMSNVENPITLIHKVNE